MQSLARSNAVDGDAVNGAAAGGFVLPRFLRRPFRIVMRTLHDGISLSPRTITIGAGVILAGATVAGIISGGRADDFLAQASVFAGFRVNNVDIKGTNHVSRIDILTNIDLGPDRSLFAFNVNQAREDLKRLPWIRDVSVSKAYPDTLVINVIERDPFAIWQNGQALFVVGRDGAEIEPFDDRYSTLPLVVGKGAAAHGAELIAAVERYPELAGKVRAYVRVGDRRWNLQLANGVTAMLPEFDMEGGLTELARLAREENIFEQAVEVVDLRLANRTVLRLAPKAAEMRRDRIKELIKQSAAARRRT